MSLAAKLNQTVYIYRGTASRASTGTVTRAVPDTATATCNGRLIPRHGGMVMAGTVAGDEGEFFEASAELLVPVGTDLRPEVGDSDASGQGDWVKVDSVVYRVVSGKNTANAGRLLHFLLRREA